MAFLVSGADVTLLLRILPFSVMAHTGPACGQQRPDNEPVSRDGLLLRALIRYQIPPAMLHAA